MDAALIKGIFLGFKSVCGVSAHPSTPQSTQERGFQVSSMAHDGSAKFSYFCPTLPSQTGAHKVPQDSTGLLSSPGPPLCIWRRKRRGHRMSANPGSPLPPLRGGSHTLCPQGVVQLRSCLLISWLSLGLLFFFWCHFFKNWSVVDLQGCVNFCCIAQWFSYTYIYSLPWCLSLDTEYSSLCYRVGACCLPTLDMPVCIR